VGGIGVANTMFMSVLERTKEIGILKALGLRDSELLKLFLLESASIGIIGGVVGVLLSFAFSFILAAASIPTLITLDLVALGVIFSGMIGILSGMIPARNASRLEPVEAIRYE
jgi:putative ABC transport system permease protein